MVGEEGIFKSSCLRMKSMGERKGKKNKRLIGHISFAKGGQEEVLKHLHGTGIVTLPFIHRY